MYTPTRVPDNSDGSCTFVVAVDDGNGGITTGTVYLYVTQSGAPAPLFAPSITGTTQQSSEDFDSTPLTLSVSAVSNNGGTLSFQWQLDGTKVETDTASSSSVVWTPPGCDGNSHVASVTVSDLLAPHLGRDLLLADLRDQLRGEKQYNPSATNGYYLIDADGPGGNPPVNTYCDDMGSGGGDFNPTVDTTLPGGVNRFQNIHIPAGVTVRIDPARNNGVLELRASGTVLIEGTIDVSGAPGANGPTYPRGDEGGGSLWVGGSGGDTGNPLGGHAAAPSSPVIAPNQSNLTYTCPLSAISEGLGGQGTAGANGQGYYYCGIGGIGGMFGGGTGGLGGGGGGGGWAGGAGGTFSAPYIGGNGGGPYGGAGTNGSGQGGLANDPNYNGGNAMDPTSAYGNPFYYAFYSGGGGSIGADAAADLAMLTTFRPGSGGGGGGGFAGAGGGGGGGAVRIVSPTAITVAASASILANGGNGGVQTTTGYYYNPGANGVTGGMGGGGSGGAIYLSASTVNLAGTLSANGGLGGVTTTLDGVAGLWQGNTGAGGNGGLGRIRIAADTFNPNTTTAPVVTPALPSALDGSVNASGLAFVSARYPYELVVTSSTQSLVNGNEFHIPAGSQNTYALLTIDPGYSLVIDPPTDCSDPNQMQMTSIQVGGDLVIGGTLVANENTCPAANYAVPVAAQALGAPATVTLTPGASGGAGGTGGYTICDCPGCGCGLECSPYSGGAPSGRSGGNGGQRIYASAGLEGPRGVDFCYPVYSAPGGAAGAGNGQPLFLKIGGVLAGNGTINAAGDNGGAGASGIGAICDPDYTAAGGGGGGAGGAGGNLVIRIHGTSNLIQLPVTISAAAGQGGPGGPGGGGAGDCYGSVFTGAPGGAPGDNGSPGVLDIQAY